MLECHKNCVPVHRVTFKQSFIIHWLIHLETFFGSNQKFVVYQSGRINTILFILFLNVIQLNPTNWANTVQFLLCLSTAIVMNTQSLAFTSNLLPISFLYISSMWFLTWTQIPSNLFIKMFFMFIISLFLYSLWKREITEYWPSFHVFCLWAQDLYFFLISYSLSAAQSAITWKAAVAVRFRSDNICNRALMVYPWVALTQKYRGEKFRFYRPAKSEGAPCFGYHC